MICLVKSHFFRYICFSYESLNTYESYWSIQPAETKKNPNRDVVFAMSLSCTSFVYVYNEEYKEPYVVHVRMHVSNTYQLLAV